MNGIEIVEILTPGLIYTQIIGVIALACVFGNCALMFYCLWKHMSEVIPAAIGLIICWGIFLLAGYSIKNPTIEYKVIVEDTVTLNEFTEKYEIIKQEGEYYIVEEK